MEHTVDLVDIGHEAVGPAHGAAALLRHAGTSQEAERPQLSALVPVLLVDVLGTLANTWTKCLLNVNLYFFLIRFSAKLLSLLI